MADSDDEALAKRAQGEKIGGVEEAARAAGESG